MKKKLIILSTILLTFIFSTTILATRVFADCGDVETSLIDCPNLGGGTPRYLAMDIVNILSVGIGIIGVIGISIFGIQILTARDDPARVANARKRFFQILLGLGVYLAMWTGLNWLLPGGVIFGRIPVESIKLSPTIANIAVGKTDKLIVAFQPLDADDQTLKWESSDESIATVDEFGNVTGKALGEVTIKATAVNGSTSESTVNIIANADLPAYCSASSGGTDGSSPDISTTEIPSTESTSATPYVDGLEIHFFSTGYDDDAILIRNQDKVIVIDGGRCDPSNTSGKTDSRCAPGKKFVNYLKTVGVTKIDALIGSHGDWDHIQAHSVIVENFEIAGAYYPIQLKNCVKDSVHGCNAIDIRYMYDALMKKNITPTLVDVEKEPVIKSIGDLRLFFIGPPWPRRGNKGSFVFILQYGEKRFMFTGDQTWKNLAENESLKLLKDRADKLGTNIKVDLFKWPHHGYNSNDLTEKIEKNFFEEIGASYIVVPNSNSRGCGQSQVDYAVNKLGLKKYSNCGNTNLVITSDGKTIEFHENQSPENWVPKKTVGESGKISSTPATPQSCIPLDSPNGKVATSVTDAKWDNGNECTDEVIFPGKKYPLTETAIKYFAALVDRENCPSMKGCKTEASQIINLYEQRERESKGKTGYYLGERYYSKDLQEWVTHDCWYRANCDLGNGKRGKGGKTTLNPNKPTEKAISAVKDVIVNGNRTIPAFVLSHDCWKCTKKGGDVFNMYLSQGGTKLPVSIDGISKLVPNQSIVDGLTFWCVIKKGGEKVYGDIFKYNPKTRAELGF